MIPFVPFGYFVLAAMVLAWVFGAYYFVIIGRELVRARRAGEATGIPASGRGLPFVVIFTKNALPRIETQRYRAVIALAVFAGGWLLLMIFFAHK